MVLVVERCCFVSCHFSESSLSIGLMLVEDYKTDGLIRRFRAKATFSVESKVMLRGSRLLDYAPSSNLI